MIVIVVGISGFVRSGIDGGFLSGILNGFVALFNGSGVVRGLQIVLIVRGGFVQLFVSHQHSLL